MKYQFDLREKTALGIDEISRKVHIPVEWLVEDAVETLISSYDNEIRKALNCGYNKAMREAAKHDAFDQACQKAVKGLGVIVEYELSGWRYEALAFRGKKLVTVSAKFPLKRGTTISPVEITLTESMLWASARTVEHEDALPDCSGDFASEGRWFKMVAAALAGRAL